MSNFIDSAPDFVVVRARDLKHILMMLDAAADLRQRGDSFRAGHTERTAVGQLRNLSNSWTSLSDLLARLIEETQAAAKAGADRGSEADTRPTAAGRVSISIPDGNHGDNNLNPPVGGA